MKYQFQNIVRDKNNENKTYFSIFKFHVMTHYAIFIRLYESAQSFDTAYEAATHKFLLKIFFAMTNRIND